MKKSILFTALMLSQIVVLQAQQKNFIDQAYIETRAMVDTLVVPNRITLGIFISEEDHSRKTNVESLELKMGKTLEKLGIDITKQLKLTDLSSNFKNYILRRQDIKKSKSYELEVYDAVTAGRVITALERAGISNVNLIKTSYSAMDALRIQLKSKAILKAKEQAEAMAKPLGQSVGKALYISDFNSNSNPVFYNRRMKLQMSALEEEASEETLQIEFEKIKVSASISVNFALN